MAEDTSRQSEGCSLSFVIHQILEVPITPLAKAVDQAAHPLSDFGFGGPQDKRKNRRDLIYGNVCMALSEGTIQDGIRDLEYAFGV